MPYKGKNLRTMKVTPESGKDFRDTQVTSGLGHKTRAFTEMNETTEYRTGKTAKGPLGGENTAS